VKKTRESFLFTNIAAGGSPRLSAWLFENSATCSSDRSLMAGGRVKGTGHTHNRYFWTPSVQRAPHGNDRYPKGRDAERLGCAPGAGERDPTSGRGPPKPLPELICEVPEEECLTNETYLCALHRLRRLCEALETGSAW
jgi:hypothetical protein